MFIDFHTHIFPRHRAPAIMDDLWRRGKIPHYTDGTLSGLVDSMQTAGITYSLVSRITTKAENVTAVNQWLLNCRHSQVMPLATVHPDFAVTTDDLKRLRSEGFKGVKLHPDYQGFYVDDPRMFAFYEAAQQIGFPVLFHAGLDRGLPPPVHALPHRLLKIHRLFPQMVMIAAHMGGEDNYAETEALLLGEEIYLDTAFVLQIMETETLKRFFRRHPIERILFGTDSPFTDQAAELSYLLNIPFLTTAQKELVAGGNAASLIL
ncbi:amidohydrolase family protein [Desulfosarcina cetonica]|uniref:amidohydrolase family protein n=1 Tax=Desulfosarcina cetonica TaxID=90730 RepID=UPI00155DAB82|nr:amidohydrolase family protein [Desulfosarcina cetonica]